MRIANITDHENCHRYYLRAEGAVIQEETMLHILEHTLLHTIEDSVKLLPFLFITYFLMEELHVR